MTHQLNLTDFGNPANKDNVLSREEANSLLFDWVKNDRLILHMQQVAHLMKCWAAERQNLDAAGQWKWELAGLLHDADWDQFPDEHCRKIIGELKQREVDPEIIHAIASHGPRYFGVEPETSMDKMLYAFDELSGFIHAYSLMRPGGYGGMETKGVKKRMKDRAFAANVNRDDIQDASEKAGLSVDQLIQFVIDHQG